MGEGGDGEDGAEGETGEEIEARGAKDSVNQYTYFVTNSPLKPWTRLPDIKPSQILNSRNIKHLFSGNINAKIFTNPFFYDTEKVYLRAQIARISASTTLVPKGVMKFAEDSTREIEENTPEEGDLEYPPTQQMASSSQWLHLSPSILKQGRMKHVLPNPGPGEEELEEEERMKNEVKKDPFIPRLQPIDSDASTIGGNPAWQIRSYNINTTQTHSRTGKETVNFGTVVLRSQWWPGSITFYNNQRVQQLYVGDGQKNVLQNTTFFPVITPIMLSDKQERPCYMMLEAPAKPKEEEPNDDN